MRAALLVTLAACGGSSSGKSDAAGGDAAKPAHSGYVQAQSIDANNSGTVIMSGTASAGFFTSGAACAVTQQVGPCAVEKCTTALTGAASAGLVTITGGAETMTLAPVTDKTYPQMTASERLFAGGETLTYSAQGADIPPFTKTLTAPARATITAPAKPAAGVSLAVNRAQDFTVTWTGGTGGQIQVSLIGATIANTLLCRFDATAGSGSVPAAALAMLPAGNGGFAMASIADAEQDTGDWAIDVSAYFNAVWPDDSIVSGGTTYQ